MIETAIISFFSAKIRAHKLFLTAVFLFVFFNSLGSLVALGQSAPLEIGNRVWLDINQNSVQDADEPPIAGVTVHLYAADGRTLLQTTTTAADGSYYFSISPYTRYVIKLDNPADYTSGPLKDYVLDRAYFVHGAYYPHAPATLPRPNRPLGFAGNYPRFYVAPHLPGHNDDSYNFGFTMLNPPSLHIIETHFGGGYFQVGQQIDYLLSVSSDPGAGPVNADRRIFVIDTLPKGLSLLAATGTNWKITLRAGISPTTLTATYTEPYPLPPGAVIPPIVLNGIFDQDAVSAVSTSVTVTVGTHANPTSTDLRYNRAADTVSVTTRALQNDHSLPPVDTSNPARSSRQLNSDHDSGSTRQRSTPTVPTDIGYPGLPKTGSRADLASARQ